MRIKHIALKNFRNYPSLDLDVTSDTVILSGPNAVGKTNLLEAIFFGSLFKSFRDDTEFIFLKGTENAELKITVGKDEQDQQLEVYLEKRDRIYANFKIDGAKVKRKHAQSFFQVVIFDPTDVDLFNRPPELRRKYLNMVLAQKSNEYLEYLTTYKKILFQKNKLLQDLKQGRSKANDLETWNEQLIDVGSRIILERKKLIRFLNQDFAEVYAAISGFRQPAEVQYSSVTGESLEEITLALKEKIKEYGSREQLLASSLVGPHRDDFTLKSDGLYLTPFSSRGEQRSQIIALKILELQFLSQSQSKPILLLDDVLSELDDTRRKFLLTFLQGKFQTFITTTQPLEIPGQHITLSPVAYEETPAPASGGSRSEMLDPNLE